MAVVAFNDIKLSITEF